MAWRKICKDPLLCGAESICTMMVLITVLIDEQMELEKMWRHAIDRSCGNLVDISFQNFGIAMHLLSISLIGMH